MGCILKAEGTDFLVDAFLDESGLVPSRIFRKGEPEFPTTQLDGRVWDISKVNIRVGEKGFDYLEAQIENAITYLKNNKDEIERLCHFPGVELVYLDFGVNKRDEVVECNYFPPELLYLSGKLGIGIELSQYAMREEEDASNDV